MPTNGALLSWSDTERSRRTIQCPMQGRGWRQMERQNMLLEKYVDSIFSNTHTVPGARYAGREKIVSLRGVFSSQFSKISQKSYRIVTAPCTVHQYSISQKQYISYVSIVTLIFFKTRRGKE